MAHSEPWVIVGADRETGAEVREQVMATSEREAREKAVAFSILVSDVHSLESEIQEPFPVGGDAAAEPALRPIPYANPGMFLDISKGARLLSTLATVATVLAYLCFAASLLLLLAALLTIVGRTSSLIAALISAVVAAIYGLGMLIVAAVLRMLAAIGLAVRHLAMNSGKR